MKKTKNIQPSERELQTWFKANWHGWLTQLHPGQGSDVGIPDLILGDSSGLLPVEVKLGSIDEDNILWCSAIRPAQIVWHKALADAGFNSILLVGVYQGSAWRPFVVDASLSRFAEISGFKVGETAFELDVRNLEESLSEFVFRQLEQ